MAWPGFTLLAAVGVAMLYSIYVYSTNNNTYSSSQSSRNFPHDAYFCECNDNYTGPRRRRRRRRRRDHENNSECSICLRKLEDEVVELACNHKFHYDCIQKWIDAKRPSVASCPICRHPIYFSWSFS